VYRVVFFVTILLSAMIPSTFFLPTRLLLLILLGGNEVCV